MQILKKIIYQCLCTCLLAGTVFILSAESPPNREYQVKAVFLFNFTQFVEWPEHSFSKPNMPLVIGILGTDHFGTYLDEIVANENVNGHRLVIQRFATIENVEGCHILFISQTEANIEQLIPNLNQRNILTVSDAPNFIQKGGIIRFITVNNKIQLQINPEAAKDAGLTISSKLLRLAEIVVPNK